MPDRIINGPATLAGCLLHGATYGACLHLLGMPIDALLLGAIAASIAHGLREATTRKAGWSRIGIGTLLAGAGAPATVYLLFHYVNVGDAETSIRPVAQALAAIVIGAAWPDLSVLLRKGLSNLITKFTGGAG